MFLLDSLLVDGLRFVLDKVAAAADAELQDDAALRERLLEAQMECELGELSEADYVAIERDVLTRLREIRGAAGGAISMDGADIEVESALLPSPPGRRR